MTVELENHIHLSTALGGAPENAPSITWKVTNSGLIPIALMDPRRTRGGKFHRNITRKSNGQELQLQGNKYVILLTGPNRLENLVTLIGLHGKLGYAVDNLHCADGVDHTPYVRKVGIQIGTITTDASKDPGMQAIQVEIELEDNSVT